MSNILEQIFKNSDFKKIDNSQFFYANQLSLLEVIDLIKNSEYYDLFKKEMSNIELDKIYTSETHGISHNERTAILIMAIALLENYTESEIKICLYGAKYHDIGRVNDNEDDSHGLRSGELLDQLKIELADADKAILKCACIGHSINDEFYDEVITDIKDKKKAIRVFKALKDADALDRVRLKYDGLNPKYLRTTSSTRLINAAYELFYNYNLIKETKHEQRNNQRN